jgi:hypothetical protein
MNEKLELEVTYGNGDRETLLVTPLDGNKFRLEESTLTGEAYYGDTIELTPTGQNRALFQRVIARSGLKVLMRTLSNGIQDSPRFAFLLDKILQFGGYWERVMGGILIVHLPDNVDFNLDAELKAIHFQVAEVPGPKRGAGGSAST